MSSAICPCGSGNPLDSCCGRYHAGQPAPCAEALMRSRYSAYVLGSVDYLLDTTLPAQKNSLDRESISQWSAQSTWLGLEVESAELSGGTPKHAFVTFTARWHDATGETVIESVRRSCRVRAAGISSIRQCSSRPVATTHAHAAASRSSRSVAQRTWPE